MSNRLMTILLAIAAILLFTASLSLWTWINVIDSSRFAGIAGEVVEKEEVRQAIATRIVDRLLEDRPILRWAVGDAVAGATAGVLASDRFAALLDRLVEAIHRVLVSGGFDDVTIDVSGIRLVVDTLASLFSDDAENEPASEQPDEIVLLEGRHFPALHRFAVAVPWVAVLTGLAGLAILAIGLARAAERSRAMLTAGPMLAGAGLLTVVLSLPVRSTLVLQFPTSEQEIIVGELYDAFVGRLFLQAAGLIVIGLAFVAAGVVLTRRRASPALGPPIERPASGEAGH